MRDDGASRTAFGAAQHRQYHQVFDGTPKILEDRIIGKLLGSGSLESLMARKAYFDSAAGRGLRSSIVLRGRYAEDRLRIAVDEGIGQVLFLGAGLETYAYRQANPKRPRRIFEIDHPSTQGRKRGLLESAGLAMPENLVFVPVDFESMDLMAELGNAQFARGEPSFISWLGVTVYLTEAAIDEVLSFAAGLAKGSQLVLSYAEPPTESVPAIGRATIAQRAEAAGEPWISFFAPEEMEAKLRAHGFSEILRLGPEEAERLFAGRTDGLRAPRRPGLVTAIV
jgi:methyltransferase (TIGR00027 family)